MKLSNGDQILSFSKPKPRGDSYQFMDEMGVNHIIPQNRVVKIKAVSVVKDEPKPSAPAKPKKPTHWYFLWLA
jgi:hypothetical protein